ncbi:MAG TPA: L-seryl-tRNA(Sec) selenium transferase [Candidatus Eisenbacteria bacterium]|nr:L-seryl-tRNA(Sec) selenium transferase [Candidatus Eisenbacteria bacterium]
MLGCQAGGNLGWRGIPVRVSGAETVRRTWQVTEACASQDGSRKLFALETVIKTQEELFRLLPAVDELLRGDAMQAVVSREGHGATVAAARGVLDELRSRIGAGTMTEAEIVAAVAAAPAELARRLQAAMTYSLRPVINATGVILHTNLGRAPLSGEALRHVVEVAQGYSNLELDLETGERGKRDVHVSRLFAKLLGSGSALNPHFPKTGERVGHPESSADPALPKGGGMGHPYSSLSQSSSREVATIVVNNNAAAVLLTLNALAEGGEVIVSRGELVEIGGSFRIPDVMIKSGAVLREVGTTNRTRIADYEQAINERTKLLLRVHRSNFEITGFTEQPSLEELSALGRKRGVPVMEDLGSGDIFDLPSVGVRGEPTIAASLCAGVDVVTFSGDKLLGGPQAGLITGERELVARVRKNPLFRALRVDKMFYAALEATLLAYLREDYDAIPALRMMRLTEEAIGERAEHMMRKLHVSSPKLNVEVVATRSVIGGGSAPGARLPTRALAVSSPDMGADEIARKLREWVTPIIARVEEGQVLLDLRTVGPEQDDTVVRAVEGIAIGD